MNPFNPKNFLFLLAIILLMNCISYAMDDGMEKGVQLFNEKKYPEAKTFFESFVRTNPDNPETAFYLGKIFLIENNYDRAIDWLKKAVELDDKNSDYHLWLGRAYGVKAQRAGMLKKAPAARNVKTEFEKAVELDPDNMDARWGLLQFYLMAPGIMGGSKDKASAQAEEIKKRNSYQGRLAFGFIHTMNEKYDLAEKEYFAAIQEKPDDYQSYNQLGYLYTRQKEFQKAFDLFEKLIKDHPKEISAYFQIGRLAVTSGKNLDRGVECLNQYLKSEPTENSPSFAWAHLLLGHIQKQKGNKDLARIEYETALKLDPDFKSAKKALEELK
jgi:tetratricopeptide (TPR) repeat protein